MQTSESKGTYGEQFCPHVGLQVLTIYLIYCKYLQMLIKAKTYLRSIAKHGELSCIIFPSQATLISFMIIVLLNWTADHSRAVSIFFPEVASTLLTISSHGILLQPQVYLQVIYQPFKRLKEQLFYVKGLHSPAWNQLLFLCH